MAPAIAVVLLTARALACECSTVPLDQEFADAEAVFEGEVVDAGGLSVVIRVVRSWKGARSGKVTLRTIASNCRIDVERGERRLLFVRHESLGGDEYDLTACSRHPLVDSDAYRAIRSRLVELSGRPGPR